MASSKDREDILREQSSEWEGMASYDTDKIYSIYNFLGQIKAAFTENHSLQHVEETIPYLAGKMDKTDREKFMSVISAREIADYFKEFLGEKEWDSLENLESNRIMEFDQHEGQGIG